MEGGQRLLPGISPDHAAASLSHRPRYGDVSSRMRNPYPMHGARRSVQEYIQEDVESNSVVANVYFFGKTLVMYSRSFMMLPGGR